MAAIAECTRGRGTISWESFLDELLLEIFSYLPRVALVAAGQANRHWNRISKDRILEHWCWFHTARDLGLEPLKGTADWKTVVLANHALGRGAPVEERRYTTQCESFSACAIVGREIILSYGTRGVLERRCTGPEESCSYSQDPSEYTVMGIFPTSNNGFYSLNSVGELRHWTIEQDGSLTTEGLYLHSNFVKDVEMVGRWLIACHENILRLADLDDTQNGILKFVEKQQFERGGGLLCVDSKSLAVSQLKGKKKKRIISVFEIQEDQSFTLLHELESNLIDPSHYCRRGNRLAVASFATLEIWDLTVRKRTCHVRMPQNINALTLAGNTLILSCKAKVPLKNIEMHCLQFINLETMKIFYTYPIGCKWHAFEIDTRGNQVVARTNNRVLVLTFQSGRK